MDKAKQATRGDAWRIAKPYWASEEKWSAWGLLLAVVTLNLGTVYISVRINEWNNAFYDALQTLNGGEFFRQIGIFCFLAALAIIMSGRLSGPLQIPFGSLGIVHIPAYLVWAALLYAGVGTWLTIKIGRPLVPLNFARQRFEADFRFSLVRMRENAESVALYGGERVELNVFNERFKSVFENFWQIMKRQKSLTWFTTGYAQVAIIFPVVAVAPRYFAKQIELG